MGGGVKQWLGVDRESGRGHVRTVILMNNASHFLGVSNSLSGKAWRQRPGDDQLALEHSRRLKQPDLVGRLLASRGVKPDEAELFLNGQSLGRKKKGPLEYRLRWDDVKYAPGELKVVAYKNGKPWANSTMKTTGAAAKLTLAAVRR